MIRGLSIFMLFGLTGLAIASHATAPEAASQVLNWDFDVYLDEKKVGKHQFTVSDTDGVRIVQSEASFKVKVFFIPAYRYQHNAAERWSGDCLAEFEASTNANGKRIEVSGKQTAAGFMIKAGDSPVELPECVMTFAYWNAEFLDQPRLLNPQTGEYVDVLVEELGDEILEVRGQAVSATRFKLTASEVDLTLWYSDDDEWLALESIAKGGRVIRYELS